MEHLWPLGGIYGIKDCLSVSWMWFFYQPVPWWVYLISFGAMWGMLTTYWDFLFGYDNFFMHGAGIAFAFIPFAIVSGGWLGFGIRFISLALTMGIWSKCFGDVDVEECGRGAFITATLPFAIVSGGWLGFGIRFISLAIIS